ncbi:Aldo/keto reductase family protein [compost metagenome]
MGLLGCKFQEFSQYIPNWLDAGTVEQARRIQAIAERHNLPLEMLALRFLLNMNAVFKIVLGAANRQQLQNSLDAIKQGVLPVNIYNEILQTFNDNK